MSPAQRRYYRFPTKVVRAMHVRDSIVIFLIIFDIYGISKNVRQIDMVNPTNQN
jgi:hypothetical protein